VEIEVGDAPGELSEVYTVPDTAVSDPTGLSVIKNSKRGFDTIMLTVPSTGNPKKFARLKVSP
jgi:hypothetical protein